MNSGATIFDDQETVELLRGRPHLLAIADAVRATQAKRTLPGRPRTLLLVATVATCIAVAAPGIVFSGVLNSSQAAVPRSQPRPAPRGARPMGFDPMTLNIARDGGAVTSVGVTVNAPARDAATLLQVITGSPYGHIVSPATRKVVFQEQVPMTNIASPASGPNGTVALSTWSGTLSPSDWTGGCRHATYEVYATTVLSGTSFDNPSPGSVISGSQWFTCSG